MIIELVVYMGVLKGHQLGWFKLKLAALLVVIVPFIITTIIIPVIALDGAMPNLATIFTANAVIKLLLQTVLAFIIFRFIENKDESISAWVAIAIFGYIALYAIAPYLVDLVVR